ncbi:MAG TPA: CU044_5270 family protein [Solirubrobacteraceae bacterium]|jgi:hypothetical protein|nr:CU044_5270 family protein [Solirubrobacteraceae bacterium]
MTSLIPGLEDQLRVAARQRISPSPSLSLPPRRRRSRRRRLVPLAGAAVVGVAALGFALAQHPRVTPTPTRELAAVTELHRLSRVAASQRPLLPGPGQYLYTAMDQIEVDQTPIPPLNGCAVYVPDRWETWVAENGGGLERQTEALGKPVTTPSQRCQPVQALSADAAGIRYTWFPAGMLQTSATVNLELGFDPASLPTDPTILGRLIAERRLDARVGGRLTPAYPLPAGVAGSFTIIGDLLRETNLSPALRSALYTVAATLPGVRLLGTVVDPLGGRGLALTMLAFVPRGQPPVRDELIFDPRTSALIGESRTLTDGDPAHDLPAGTTSWSAYTTRIVNALPAKPPACLRDPSTCSSGELASLEVGSGTSVISSRSDAAQVTGQVPLLEALEPTF